MNKKPFLILGIVLSTFVSSGVAERESTQDDNDILIAVFSAIKDRLPAGDVVVDRANREWLGRRSERVGAAGAHARATRLGAALGLRVASFDDIRQCPTGPSSCRLIGAAGIVQFGEPDTRDDGTAIVLVQVASQTNLKRTPVALEVLKVVVQRQADEWRVTDVEVVGRN